jgi:hypothetical protein
MQPTTMINSSKAPLLRRFGKWGFAFFLLKGLAWLSPLALARLVG